MRINRRAVLLSTAASIVAVAAPALAQKKYDPGASDTDLLLTSPDPIRAGVDANLARAVCAIRAGLDSAAEQDYASFFYGNARFADLPARSGYYLGYLAAKQATCESVPH